jgi:hypothetical protein
VFGRRAGIYAAKYVKKAKVGKITLNHIDKYNKMLETANIKPTKTAPIILPEYRGEMAISRSLDIF